ncbi:hypothetical protein D3C77_569180 [compost metagenome]
MNRAALARTLPKGVSTCSGRESWWASISSLPLRKVRFRSVAVNAMSTALRASSSSWLPSFNARVRRLPVPVRWSAPSCARGMPGRLNNPPQAPTPATTNAPRSSWRREALGVCRA